MRFKVNTGASEMGKRECKLNNGQTVAVRAARTHLGDRVFEARVAGRLFASAFTLRELVAFLARQ